jgi:hypothetical protein
LGASSLESFAVLYDQNQATGLASHAGHAPGPDLTAYAPLVKFTEIASRMTGFSSPVFGLSWQPPTPDVTIARRVLAFLEDRQVLYAPYEVEIPERCIASVMRIRDFLTGLLGDHALGGDLADSLRAMRSACRKFMNTVDTRSSGLIGRLQRIIDTETGESISIPPGHISMNDIEFNQALGELRGVFGIHVGLLATKYGLDVEDGLASILPEGGEG